MWMEVRMEHLSVWGVAEGGLCLGVLQKELVSEADAGASAQVLPHQPQKREPHTLDRK